MQAQIAIAQESLNISTPETMLYAPCSIFLNTDASKPTHQQKALAIFLLQNYVCPFCFVTMIS